MDSTSLVLKLGFVSSLPDAATIKLDSIETVLAQAGSMDDIGSRQISVQSTTMDYKPK